MRKTMTLLAFVGLMLFSISNIAAQQSKAITNADVVDMVKAGLPENTIVLAIQQSQTNFDTSPQSLIELKKQGVSQKILETMLQPKGTTPTKNPNTNNPLSGQTEISDSTAATMEVTLIDAEKRIAMKRSQGNMRGNSGMIMNPFGKVKVKSALDGNHALLRITDTTPEFEISLPTNVNAGDYLVLIKFDTKSDRREVEVARAGITGSSQGFRKESVIPTTFVEVKTQDFGSGMKYTLYRVKVVNPLPPGEYAFVPQGGYYDFGIDKGQ